MEQLHAGTLLAYELEERQKSFIIFDDNAHNASLTAAGMVNPVVLKRFSPVWNGKQQILKARETMAKFSEFITEKTNYQFDILRIFNNEQERTTWANKISLPQLEDLLDTTFYPSPSSDIVAPFGVGKVHYGGRMDLHTVLSSFRKKFKTNNQLVEEQFDYRQLVINDSIIHYKNITAHNIVFCEGYGLKNNPYFNELPLNGNKGEILHVRIPNLQLKESVKSSVFIMPLPEYGDDMYFIGATYNWTDKDNIPTDAGREELLNKLQKILTKECFAKVEVVTDWELVGLC